MLQNYQSLNKDCFSTHHNHARYNMTMFRLRSYVKICFFTFSLLCNHMRSNESSRGTYLNRLRYRYRLQPCAIRWRDDRDLWLSYRWRPLWILNSRIKLSLVFLQRQQTVHSKLSQGLGCLENYSQLWQVDEVVKLSSAFIENSYVDAGRSYRALLWLSKHPAKVKAKKLRTSNE